MCDFGPIIAVTQVWAYDSDGVKIKQMPLSAQKTDVFGESNVAGIHWYHSEVRMCGVWMGDV